MITLQRSVNYRITVEVAELFFRISSNTTESLPLKHNSQ